VFKDIIDKTIENGHDLVGDTHVRINLLEDEHGDYIRPINQPI
jgi:hypothetical protein